MNLLTEQKETHRLRKQTYSCWGDKIVREFRKFEYIHCYIFRMDNQQRPIV